MFAFSNGKNKDSRKTKQNQNIGKVGSSLRGVAVTTETATSAETEPSWSPLRFLLCVLVKLMRVRACVPACVRACVVRACVRACVHVHMCVCVCVHVRACVRACVHACMPHACVRACMHAACMLARVCLCVLAQDLTPLAMSTSALLQVTCNLQGHDEFVAATCTANTDFPPGMSLCQLPEAEPPQVLLSLRPRKNCSHSDLGKTKNVKTHLHTCLIGSSHKRRDQRYSKSSCRLHRMSLSHKRLMLKCKNSSKHPNPVLGSGEFHSWSFSYVISTW